MGDDFSVRLSAGSLRAGESAYTLPHTWTDAGVAVEGGGTGAHLFHAAIALCVLNDTFREAGATGLDVRGVAVTARGGFSGEWSSTGVRYAVELDSAEDADRLTALLARVDEVAEIPRAVRVGAEVSRVGE